MKAEFFKSAKGLTGSDNMVKIDGEYSAYDAVQQSGFIQRVMLALLNNEHSRKVVHKMQQIGITEHSAIVEQFRKCNWDALDSVPDIDENDKLNFEYVKCDYKSHNKKCPFSQPGDPTPFCIYRSLAHVPNIKTN